MCGIFGFVSFDNEGPSLERLKAIACVTQQRGEDAFGFAWVDGKGRLRSYKQSGRITDHLGSLAMVADARMLIGHCRWATHGSPRNNLNNHPHPADSGWIVHNGVIKDYEGQVGVHDLWPVSECDSEVLGLLIENGKGDLLRRCARAVAKVKSRPLVLMGLWTRPNRLVIVRDGNPLSMGVCSKGERRYFGSFAEGLPGAVSEVPNGAAWKFVNGTLVEGTVDESVSKGRSRSDGVDGLFSGNRFARQAAD